MAFTGHTSQYISSAKWTAVTAWASGATVAAGVFRRQLATPSTNNERVWVSIVGGTTGGVEPTWTFSRGDKVTDNTVTWQECTGLPGVNNDFASTPNWINGAKSTNVSQGHIIKDAAGTHLFICSVGGNAGTGSEPTWNTAAVGNTTTDASATWVYLGTSFTAWGAPHARLRNASVNNWHPPLVAGVVNKYYVGHDNAETQAAGWNMVTQGSPASPTDILCVASNGSLPPVAADLATTATLTTTGSNSIGFQGQIRCMYGITVNNGSSGNLALNFMLDDYDKRFENCTFTFPAGNGSSVFQFNGARALSSFLNCTFTFSATGQGFVFGGFAEIIGGTINGSAVPANLFINSGSGGRVVLRGVDMSFLSGSVLVHSQTSSGFQVQILDCKMPSSFTPATYTSMNNRNDQVYISRSDSAGHNYQFTYMDTSGRIDAEPLVARVGGAADGGTAISWKCATTANINAGCGDLRPPSIAEWNAVTGSNVTGTIYGIINAAAIPNNLEAWTDIDYLGTASSSASTRKTSRVADFIATPGTTTADTSDWTAGTSPARANATAYTLGQAIKLASNPGRLFFCTTAGTSAGSEPGGYASAVDGGSVTDNTAVFRAGCRFRMAVTLTSPTPQAAGNVYCGIRLSKPSITCYFDPSLALT